MLLLRWRRCTACITRHVPLAASIESHHATAALHAALSQTAHAPAGLRLLLMSSMPHSTAQAAHISVEAKNGNTRIGGLFAAMPRARLGAAKHTGAPVPARWIEFSPHPPPTHVMKCGRIAAPLQASDQQPRRCGPNQCTYYPATTAVNHKRRRRTRASPLLHNTAAGSAAAPPSVSASALTARGRRRGWRAGPRPRASWRRRPAPKWRPR